MTPMTTISEYRVCSASDGVQPAMHAAHVMQSMWQSRHQHVAAESTTCLHTCQKAVHATKCSSCMILLSAWTHQGDQSIHAEKVETCESRETRSLVTAVNYENS